MWIETAVDEAIYGPIQPNSEMKMKFLELGYNAAITPGCFLLRQEKQCKVDASETHTKIQNGATNQLNRFFRVQKLIGLKCKFRIL